MTLTFLLPGDACSGGIRATMQMGNRLLRRGHDVRIAYRAPRVLSRETALSLARSLKFFCSGIQETRWLRFFEGKKEAFLRVQDLAFEENEIVIAVGNSAVGELSDLKRNVHKVRYCHGFVERTPEEMERVWGGPMRTMAVSPRLVPTLQQHCTSPLLDEYSAEKENGHRNGIGFIYHGSPHKGAAVIGPLVKALQAQFPAAPCRAFGSFPRPPALRSCEYARYPAVDCARGIYNRCQVWLITSRDEGFCLPILEAMACGCAVVSSRHTNATELIQEGVNGFTVPYGDVDGYVKIVEKLLTDESLRNRIVEEGFKTARRFSWDNAADIMERVLAGITDRPASDS
jgi:glycosyltransferase involved in cell wall biosynthesis